MPEEMREPVGVKSVGKRNGREHQDCKSELSPGEELG